MCGGFGGALPCVVPVAFVCVVGFGSLIRPTFKELLKYFIPEDAYMRIMTR